MIYQLSNPENMEALLIAFLFVASFVLAMTAGCAIAAGCEAIEGAFRIPG